MPLLTYIHRVQLFSPFSKVVFPSKPYFSQRLFFKNNAIFSNVSEELEEFQIGDLKKNLLNFLTTLAGSIYTEQVPNFQTLNVDPNIS